MFYSSFLNIKPLLDTVAPLRQKAFAAQKRKENRPPPVVLGQLPPRTPNDKRIRVALYASLFDSHGHGLPHMIFWATCLDRAKYEPVFVFHQSWGRLEDNVFFERHKTLSSYAPIVVIYEENLEALKEFQFDLFYNFDDLCKGANERTGYTRIAPVQATGFYTPATTGAPCVDAFLTAHDLDPHPENAFSEKIIFSDGLPFCFHYESYYGVSHQRPYLDADIPEDSIIYTSGSSALTKIRPIFTQAVLDILEKEPRALWIFALSSNKKERVHLVEDLISRCRARGLDPNRIRLYKYVGRPILLGLIEACDVFLDFFPFTGTNNILDPINVGTPCVTLCAENGYSRNRIAAMILNQVGLPDLVAPTPEAFVAKALELGRDRAKNAAIRQRMGNKALRESPLCDGQRFALRIEKAFEEMLKIANLAPPCDAPPDRRDSQELAASLHRDFDDFNHRKAMWCLDADMRTYSFESYKPFLPETKNGRRALVLYPQNVTEIKHISDHYEQVDVLTSQSPIIEHLAIDGPDLAFNLRDDALETLDCGEGPDCGKGYDAIFSFHHLQLTENPKDLIHQAHRLLRENGLLFIATPNAASGSRRLARELGFIKDLYELPPPFPFACAPQIRHFFDRPRLLQLLEEEKFTIKESGGLLFKTLTDAQMRMLQYHKMIGAPYFYALYKLGVDYPDLCYTVFAIAQKTPV